MDTLFTALESGAVLVAGLAIRMGLLLVVLAALSVPVFLFLTGMKGVDAVRRRMQGVMRIGHLFWSDNVYYAPSHTWIRPVGRQRVRVGFDDLAQRVPAPHLWRSVRDQALFVLEPYAKAVGGAEEKAAHALLKQLGALAR